MTDDDLRDSVEAQMPGGAPLERVWLLGRIWEIWDEPLDWARLAGYCGA